MAKQQICTNCHYVGKGKVPGSFLVELVAWCLFLIPGIIYSFWRLTSKKNMCPACGATLMIPTDTPKGRKLLEKSRED